MVEVVVVPRIEVIGIEGKPVRLGLVGVATE